MKGRRILKVVIFIIGLIFLTARISGDFTIGDADARHSFETLYQEQKGRLDAVYIGASNVYAYWQPPLGWEEYGITVASLAQPDQPGLSILYMMKEARKTQPEALYIISLNSLKDTKLKPEHMHYVLDYMRPSLNKLSLVRTIGRRLKKDWREQLEYMLPLIRFHSKWNVIKSRDLIHEEKSVKGAISYDRFVRLYRNVSAKMVETDERSPLEEEQERLLNELLDYCDREGVRALFVTVPQALGSKTLMGRVNSLADLAEQRGYPVLNLAGKREEIGLDPAIDFYNEMHTNIHGSLKYCHYLGDYLCREYGFEDKRGKKGYEDWEAAAENYHLLIDGYTLDFEREHRARDYSLAPVSGVKASAAEDGVVLTWKGSRQADGCVIYRRYSGAPWNFCGDTEGPAEEWKDVNGDKTGAYIVVPYKNNGTEKAYGKFYYRSVSAQKG